MRQVRGKISRNRFDVGKAERDIDAGMRFMQKGQDMLIMALDCLLRRFYPLPPLVILKQKENPLDSRLDE